MSVVGLPPGMLPRGFEPREGHAGGSAGRQGATGDLAPGLGDSRAGGHGPGKQPSDLVRIDRFEAALNRAAGVSAPLPAMPLAGPDHATGTAPGHDPAPARDAGEGETQVLALVQPQPPGAPLAPLPGQPAAQGQPPAAHPEIAALMTRIGSEMRALVQAMPGGGEGIRLNLDLGRTALGVQSLTMVLSPQSLTLVLNVPPGGAAHDLPQAVQALAMSLAQRYPGRTIRIEAGRGDTAEHAETAAADPLTVPGWRR